MMLAQAAPVSARSHFVPLPVATTDCDDIRFSTTAVNHVEDALGECCTLGMLDFCSFMSKASVAALG